MKSIFAIAMMLAAATSAEYMTESEAQIMTFTEYEELMTEEVEPRRLGSKGWGGGSKGSKGWGGSSKSSKSSSSEDCEPIIKYIYVQVPMWGNSWGGDDDYSWGSSGKSGKGSGKSGKGSWGGSGKSGKGSGGWGGSGKSGKSGGGGWW